MKEKAKTEKEMREAEDPCPRSLEELKEYVGSLVNRESSYGTDVYAASLAAVAAFNFVADAEGMSGFQAGCAHWDVICRLLHERGPMILLKPDDFLYPQYNPGKKLREFKKRNATWFAEEASKKLKGKGPMAPEVRKHLEKLVVKGLKEV